MQTLRGLTYFIANTPNRTHPFAWWQHFPCRAHSIDAGKDVSKEKEAFSKQRLWWGLVLLQHWIFRQAVCLDPNTLSLGRVHRARVWGYCWLPVPQPPVSAVLGYCFWLYSIMECVNFFIEVFFLSLLYLVRARKARNCMDRPRDQHCQNCDL